MTRSRHARLRLLGAALVATSVALLAPLPAAAAPATEPPQSYVVFDAGTGKVIESKDPHVPHLTASTIKVLTALVALEHLPMGAPVHVSALAAAQPAAKIDMKEGNDWPMDQTLDSLMMVSANDAAYALAETTGGSLDGFATMVTTSARRLGLRDTDFHDPAGLDGHDGYGGGTTSSAYDLAIVARNALTVPAITDPASKEILEFTDPTGAGRRLVNHNRGFLSTYPGAIGLKTGFTTAASRTLIAAATRNGRTCVSVVMGTWDDTGWAGSLLDDCFAATGAPAGAEQLPPVRIVTADARLGALAALPRTLGGAVATAPAAATPAAATLTDPAPVAGAGAAVASRTRSAATETAAPAPAANPASSERGVAWGSILRTAGLALLGLLVILVLLRRRAVKRRRARRIAWQRAHAEARRRGMIDVIETADSEVRLMPTRTATNHHVAATGRRRPPDRRVVRPTRPRHADQERNR